MTTKPEYLSMAYWDDLRQRMRKAFGDDNAELLFELAFAVRFEHERNERNRTIVS